MVIKKKTDSKQRASVKKASPKSHKVSPSPKTSKATKTVAKSSVKATPPPKKVTKRKGSPKPKPLIQTKTPKAEKPVAKAVTATPSQTHYDLKAMLEAGVHFGHQSKRWHPKMDPYIWQNRDGVHIFDLIKTSHALAQACEAVKEHLKSGKTLAFVGTKRQASAIVKSYALKAGVSYIVTRWAGGTVTNWKQIAESIKRYQEVKEGLKTNAFIHYTKKERGLLDREVSRLERLFGGIAQLTQPPQALFIIDINREKTAIREARQYDIPIFALVDSNVDPTMVDYPIPCNDDAVRSIELMVGWFTDAVIAGKALAAPMATQPKIGT